MAVTLKMLAEHTGFSPATISRVLNNDPSMSVSEETRRIIFDTAKKLGYAGGSGRRTQRIVTDTMTIGIDDWHCGDAFPGGADDRPIFFVSEKFCRADLQ